MKIIIIEGSPQELAEYDERTGAISRHHSGDRNASGLEGEQLPAENGQTIGHGEFEGAFDLRSFVYGRAREPKIAGYVETYIRRVLDLGGTEVEIGTSRTSRDGRANYLLVYDAGPRRFGAVSYVNAKNAGLTLRLTKDDVTDITDHHVKLRKVNPRNRYQINCPVVESDAIDLAVKLTQRAVDKVRNTGSSEPPDGDNPPT